MTLLLGWTGGVMALSLSGCKASCYVACTAEQGCGFNKCYSTCQSEFNCDKMPYDFPPAEPNGGTNSTAEVEEEEEKQE